MQLCPECFAYGEIRPSECSTCGRCGQCCECVVHDDFDADELGLDPEEEFDA